MNILFINPPEGEYSPGRSFSYFKSHSPPLGLLYLASILEKEGHKLSIIDFGAEDYYEEKVIKALPSFDIIGLTVNAFNYQSSKGISKLIKNFNPNLCLIIGGPLCSLSPKQMINDLNADICVKGEAEHTISDIIKYSSNKEKLSQIPGIYFKDKGKIKIGPPEVINEDVDSVPFPARHLVEKYEYGYTALAKSPSGKFTSIVTSRGCPFQCTFCCLKGIIKKFRLRSAENTVNEFIEIDKNYDSVIIMDDNFFIDKKRAEKIADELIKHKVKLDICIMGVRIDSVEYELFKKLKRAGLSSVFFGIESGNQEILDYYKKGITLDQIKRSLKICRKLGIYTLGNFIVGSPIETSKHIKDTYDFAKKIPLNTSSFSPFRYLKGSDLWKEAYEEGKIKDEEFILFTDPNRCLGNFSHDFLKKWSGKASISIYLSPRHLLSEFFLILLRKDFGEFKTMYQYLINKISGKYHY